MPCTRRNGRGPVPGGAASRPAVVGALPASLLGMAPVWTPSLVLHPFHADDPIIYVIDVPTSTNASLDVFLQAAGFYVLAGIALVALGKVIRWRSRSGRERANGPLSGRDLASSVHWVGGRVLGLAAFSMVAAALLVIFPGHTAWIIGCGVLGMFGGTLSLLLGNSRRMSWHGRGVPDG